jgi:hypothetical protein
MKRIVASLAIVACAALGCRSKPNVSLREGAREYVASDYEELRERWTRGDRLYSQYGVDDSLTVDATFESWEFRWAYVIRYSDDYKLTIDQRRELLTNALNDARKHHQFYVALYGNRPRDGDLASSKPAWVVRLVDDQGHITAPEEIIAIKRPGVLEKTYFPYTTSWRWAFRIRFPAATPAGPTVSPDAKVVSLRFSGPLGNLELPWVLEK